MMLDRGRLESAVRRWECGRPGEMLRILEKVASPWRASPFFGVLPLVGHRAQAFASFRIAREAYRLESHLMAEPYMALKHACEAMAWGRTPRPLGAGRPLTGGLGWARDMDNECWAAAWRATNPNGGMNGIRWTGVGNLYERSLQAIAPALGGPDERERHEAERLAMEDRISAAIRDVAGPWHRPHEPPWEMGRHRWDDGYEEGKTYCRACHALMDSRSLGTLCREARVERPSWITSDVLAMARSSYAVLDWKALPIIADALEEAGCRYAPLLEHLKGWDATPHGLGCWALELLLGVPSSGADASRWRMPIAGAPG